MADTHNHKIRRIHAGEVTTLAGTSQQGGSDGKGNKARFSFPKTLIFDGAHALVADRHNHKIRKVTDDGTVSTVAGTYKGSQDGPIATARFNEPCGVAVDTKGAIWVADRDNDRIRRVADGVVVTVAGSSAGHANGPALSAKFNSPWGIAVGADGVVLIGDSKNHRIRKLVCP